jgi:hypothetical protein
VDRNIPQDLKDSLWLINNNPGRISPGRQLFPYRIYGRVARDSVTITKVPETTACRVLPNARGKVKLPAAEAGHHHD